ncbi:suppressor of fused domain protein [Paenibacillus herberti]|uniref:Suppressor of fused-like domain-containing protein n=1 Tax=Paenibacillus herberti TaxID=1619309 RepID=A0A229NXT5_9BACL|nr:suppressor of fused domain protein [Paenibacillus herberti]OXM14667.1 hypothetical protein CGZ75_17295 [Paenibacillus herberti]
MSTTTFSASGVPILHHEAKEQPAVEVHENEAYLDLVTSHVESTIGPVTNVFHELLSDHVHLDILFVAPTPERNYHTLVTCGMGLLPMTVPNGAEDFRYAELMLCLPPDWSLSDESFRQEEHYWPIRALKTLARLPHEYNTWLYAAHTIPNGNPAEPYAPTTKLSGMMVSIPSTVEPLQDFFTLSVSAEQAVHFFGLIPLYKEEMDFSLKHGAEELYGKIKNAGVTELVQPSRKNVCKKWFGLF